MPTYEVLACDIQEKPDHGIRANILLSIHLITSSVPSEDTYILFYFILFYFFYFFLTLTF